MNGTLENFKMEPETAVIYEFNTEKYVNQIQEFLNCQMVVFVLLLFFLEYTNAASLKSEELRSKM